MKDDRPKWDVHMEWRSGHADWRWIYWPWWMKLAFNIRQFFRRTSLKNAAKQKAEL